MRRGVTEPTFNNLVLAGSSADGQVDHPGLCHNRLQASADPYVFEPLKLHKFQPLEAWWDEIVSFLLQSPPSFPDTSPIFVAHREERYFQKGAANQTKSRFTEGDLEK